MAAMRCIALRMISLWLFDRSLYSSATEVILTSLDMSVVWLVNYMVRQRNIPRLREFCPSESTRCYSTQLVDFYVFCPITDKDVNNTVFVKFSQCKTFACRWWSLTMDKIHMRTMHATFSPSCVHMPLHTLRFYPIEVFLLKISFLQLAIDLAAAS